MKVTATPLSGRTPLAVTFNAVVTGGVTPYIINYNFGDGTSTEAQALIHTFTSGGTYNVTVTVTDALGNVTSKFVIITVSSVPLQNQFSAFSTTIAALFFGVLEGIAEVAVVVLPLAAVAVIIIIRSATDQESWVIRRLKHRPARKARFSPKKHTKDQTQEIKERKYFIDLEPANEPVATRRI